MREDRPNLTFPSHMRRNTIKLKARKRESGSNKFKKALVRGVLCTLNWGSVFGSGPKKN